MKPQLITDDWMPSKDLYSWAEKNKIDLRTVHRCRYDFVFWHKEKQIRRANFNMAFRNWLKKELNIMEKNRTKTHAASPSYLPYKPAVPVVKNKQAGRAALQAIKEIL